VSDAISFHGGHVPHVVIESFLSEALVERLLAYTEDKRDLFEASKVGKGDLKPEARCSLQTREFGSLQGDIKAKFKAAVGDVIERLRISPSNFTKIELDLVAHGDGAYYKPHIDTATQNEYDEETARVMTGVYYFHRQPKGFSGGALRLYPVFKMPDQTGFVDVAPEYNRAVFFPAFLPHEVMPVASPSREFADSRFAINCWYRVPKVAALPSG